VLQRGCAVWRLERLWNAPGELRLQGDAAALGAGGAGPWAPNQVFAVGVGGRASATRGRDSAIGCGRPEEGTFHRLQGGTEAMRVRRRTLLLAVAVALSAGVLALTVIRAQTEEGDLEAASLETLLRGVEQREELVQSATGVMGVEMVASASYLAAEQEKHQRAFAEAGREALVEYEARDVLVTRFSYEGDRMAWQSCPVTDSGMDWWGLGSRYSCALSPPDGFRPELLRSSGYADAESVYTSDGVSTVCSVAPRAAGLPPHEPLAKFHGSIVSLWGPESMRLWRDTAALRVVGTGQVEGDQCLVVAAVGRHDPPKGLRRLWVCPAKGFAIVRMEHIELGRTGQPRSVTLETVSDLHDYGESVWLPRQARVDHWGFTGRIEWDFSRRYRVFELAVNQGFAWEVQDWLFPITRTWVDRRAGSGCLWEGWQDVGAQFEPLADPAPEPFGEAVLGHLDDLEAWVFRPADEEA